MSDNLLLTLAEEIVRLDARDPANTSDRNNEDAWPTEPAVRAALQVLALKRRWAA